MFRITKNIRVVEVVPNKQIVRGTKDKDGVAILEYENNGWLLRTDHFTLLLAEKPNMKPETTLTFSLREQS